MKQIAQNRQTDMGIATIKELLIYIPKPSCKREKRITPPFLFIRPLSILFLETRPPLTCQPYYCIYLSPYVRALFFSHPV